MGYGATADVVAGVDFVVSWHQQRGSRGSIASMSIGGSKNSVLDTAVVNAHNSGVVVVAAAGSSVRALPPDSAKADARARLT